MYCFGVLHELTAEASGEASQSEGWQEDVKGVMREVERTLRVEGVLVLAVLSGEPHAGLPQVQMYSREMFEQATAGLRALEVREVDDVGCTGQSDYHVWVGIFEK